MRVNLNIFEKILTVILSCRNQKQLSGAKTYTKLFFKKYGYSEEVAGVFNRKKKELEK